MKTKQQIIAEYLEKETARSMRSRALLANQSRRINQPETYASAEKIIGENIHKQSTIVWC